MKTARIIPGRRPYTFPVIIAGGGPVGLFLAICLSLSGIKCRVLEKRARTNPHSRSIGIHPVSLELFDRIGIAGEFMKEGLKIKRGVAFADCKKIGSLSFSVCPTPYNYVLSLPQTGTETILARELHRIDPDCLIRRADVQSVSHQTGGVKISYLRDHELNHDFCRWLVGCDGKQSIVRRSAGIPFPGKKYPDTYIMGDFSDNTGLGSDAAIYLHRKGLVESFPLPGTLRRWVVKTEKYIEAPDEETIRLLIAERLDIDLSGVNNIMVNSFGVQNYLAAAFSRNRCILAGDSAHILSPIGGQGMNLGWINAGKLAEVLELILNSGHDPKELLNKYSSESRRVARQAARRAEMNMWLGRKRNLPMIRNAIVHMIVNSPLERFMANVYTMRGLGSWPV